MKIRNAMTIDVEDYFQVSAFEKQIAPEQWMTLPCRVEANVERILALLEAQQIRATFFTLGWIAERYPVMIRRIANGGHELASHGYAHRRASDQNAGEFANGVRRSKALLEDIAGMPVLGYRAPSSSIGRRNWWALDVLRDAGYRYSSSIYPVKHDHYGMPNAPRFAFYPRGDQGILELPITTVRIMKRNLPSGGGGYFRLLPYAASRWLLDRVNTREQQPGIFYFHPWEIDHDQPRVAGIGLRTRFRHYINLQRTEARLKALTRDFSWGRMDHIFMVNK